MNENYRNFFLFLITGILFLSCKGEGSFTEVADNNSVTPTPTSSSSDPSVYAAPVVSFNLSFPFLIQQLSFSPEAKIFTFPQILRGFLYALNTDDSTSVTYDWTVYLDKSDFSAQSNETLILAPGNYEFSLLLNSGDGQYAGTAVQGIIDGENNVAMTIRPVIGEMITDVTIIDRIFDLRFQHDTAGLAVATTPQLGVLIDSNPTENLLTINPLIGITDIYISLDPGTHTLKLKFYDGSTQRGRSQFFLRFSPEIRWYIPKVGESSFLTFPGT